MTATMVWFALMGVCLVLEMLTGTFYLLMLAVALAAAALAAWLGAGLAVQLLCAALVGAAGVVVLGQYRDRLMKKSGQALAELDLDVGAVVEVGAWSSQGLAQVQHRGVAWQAVAAPGYAGQVLMLGWHEVVGRSGNALMIQPRA